MIGLPEILVLLVIILLVTGAYKKLPQLGRSAGTGARKLGETAMEKGEQAKVLAAETKEKHGDKLDPGALAQKAGKGAREAREFKDSLTGTGSSSSKPAAKPAAKTAESPSSKTRE
jgi:TatA/E family protein of Tat protein translocase